MEYWALAVSLRLDAHELDHLGPLLGFVGYENPAGRLRGSRNKLSEAVICALLRDFSKHGEKAIAKVRREQPGVYLRCLTLLVPRETRSRPAIHSRS